MTALGSAMRTTSPGSLIWLFGRNLVTRGKVVLAVALAALCVTLSVAIRQGDVPDVDTAIIELVYVFGLALMVPVLTLVISSSVLGDLVEDESLVYVWLRPVSRLTIAFTAWISALLLTLPVVTVPLVVAVGIGSSLSVSLMAATAGAVALAVVAYSAMFTLLGLITHRALIVGLLYLFVWELFVSRVGEGAAALSINTYPTAALVRWTDVTLFEMAGFGDRSLTSALLVPLVVAAVSVVATSLRLSRSRVA